MDEKEKEVIKEEAGENKSSEATEATAEASTEVSGEVTVETAVPDAKKKLHKALVRAGVALLAAIILLAVTKFSIIDLIKGAKEADTVQDEEIGTFVKRDVFAILGFLDAKTDDTAKTDANATDTTTDTSTTGTLTPAETASGEYALVPMGGKFVTVHFTKRYLESAYAIEAETYSYINGGVSSLDSYVKVEGTTEKISEDLSTKMYDWFALNKDWMVQAGVIANADDSATYLSDVIWEVDTVNSMSEVLVYTLTGLAAALVLYVIVELILMATGFYLNGPKKKKAKKDGEENGSDMEEEPAQVQEASESTEQGEATSGEGTVESVKSEETSETVVSPEAETTEKPEVQEDK